MREIGRRAVRWAARGAGALTIVATATTCVAVVVLGSRLSDAGRTDAPVGDAVNIAFLAAMVSATAVGASLLFRRPSHPVGWCFASLALGLDVAAFGESYGQYGLFIHRGGLPGDDVAALVSNSAFIVWLTAIALVCALTPDGRFLSPRWRHASQLMVGTAVAWLALKLVSDAPMDPPFESAHNPWAIDALDLPGLRKGLAAINNLLVLASAISLAVRFRRARGDQRKQLLWMAVIVVPFVALVIMAFIAAKAGNDDLLAVAAAGFVALPPIGAWLAIERWRLYDIDRILSRAVGYLVASILVASVYAIVVLVAARAVGTAASRSPTSIVLATLAAASAARPVHAAVQDLVDRRFVRRRYDAEGQMRDFVADPSSHPSVEVALQRALADPGIRVAYRLAGTEQWITEGGVTVGVDAAWHLVERSGRIIAAVSHSSDRSLLEPVLAVASPELDNAGLRAAISSQLQEVVASRRRIAQAQLDERRRIERDLHDGAQQRLLGAAAQLQAALLNGEATRMRQALELGMAECRTAVVELRELANGLHPAVLADGGLSAALEQLPARFPIATVIETSEVRCPPEVEATLWFVTCEALANAVKHADPTRLEVRLVDDGMAVRLRVDDDGRGGADPRGNGLRGLADRVEAVGGRLHIAERVLGGTSIEAVVPCEW